MPQRTQDVGGVQSISGNSTKDEVVWPGGAGHLVAQGTFDGASLQLQFSLTGKDWDDLPGFQLTSAGQTDLFRFESGTRLRIVVTGAGSSADIEAVIARPAILPAANTN